MEDERRLTDVRATLDISSFYSEQDQDVVDSRVVGLFCKLVQGVAHVH